MKKQIIAAILILCLFITLAGCGPSGEEITTPAGPVNPLTGMPIDEADTGKRPVAVCVDNLFSALPQYGVSQADIVYEFETEYGITRLYCVYYDMSDIEKVGPVRSGREDFFAMSYPLDPIYVEIGGSVSAVEAIELWRLDVLDGDIMPEIIFTDDERITQGYSIEQTKMTSGAHVDAGCELSGMRTESNADTAAFMFHHTPDENVLAEYGTADTMRFFFSISQSENASEPDFHGFDGDFRYDAASGQYKKFQFGEPQMDAGNNTQMAFDNVFVLFGDVTGREPGASDLVRFEYETGGTGYYFSKGHYVEITWTKDSFEDQFTFYNEETGEELVVNCGTSYIGITNKHKKDLLVIDWLE